MNFTSPLFLFGFLPLTIIGYFLVLLAAGRAKLSLPNLFILIASLVFYFSSSPLAIAILFLGCYIDIVLAKRFERTRDCRLLVIGVGLALTVLFYFKYLGFALDNIDSMLAIFGLGSISLPHPVLIAGVSFFTFHRISFLVDVYRGDAQIPRSFRDYLLYILIFPHMIAGPIVRFKEISAQLNQRSHSVNSFAHGAQRFTVGLAKKVLIADTLSIYVDQVFSGLPGETSLIAAWTAMLCYALQIYFDFSGYSDMAIGLAKLFCFTFPENFNSPYLSRSVTQFWRRWHITLSSWMRDYLFIPLGGNRVSQLRYYLNLWGVFLASGIWHGASWNFVLWGAAHGAMISLEKGTRWRWLGRGTTLLFLLLSWVLFRAKDLTEASLMFSALFSVSGFSSLLTLSSPMLLSIKSTLLFALLYCIVEPYITRWLARDLRPSLVISLLILSLARIFAFDFRPFIYFRF